jgi:hypothetical protein
MIMATPKTPERMTLEATTTAEALAALATFLERDGDIPARHFGLLVAYIPESEERLREAREEWFANRGEPPPPFSGEPYE